MYGVKKRNGQIRHYMVLYVKEDLDYDVAMQQFSL